MFLQRYSPSPKFKGGLLIVWVWPSLQIELVEKLEKVTRLKVEYKNTETGQVFSDEYNTVSCHSNNEPEILVVTNLGVSNRS